MEYNKVKLDRLDRLFLLSYHHHHHQAKTDNKTIAGITQTKESQNISSNTSSLHVHGGNDNPLNYSRNLINTPTKVNNLHVSFSHKQREFVKGNNVSIDNGDDDNSTKKKSVNDEKIGKIVKTIKLFIDLPTIDYYNDEMAHNKIMKFNKKLKVHTLRNFILTQFNIPEINNDIHYNSHKTNPHVKKHENENENDHHNKKTFYNIIIKSSGSLRYVGTIKYIIEECFDKLSSKRCHFEIQVTPTSFRWFNTFLNKDILALKEKFIDFRSLNTNTGNVKDSNHNSNSMNYTLTPFKEYYNELTRLFASAANGAEESLKSSKSDNSSTEDRSWSECVIVVTNSTGIKALLTILSDRPLTKFLTHDSLNALSSNTGLNSKPETIGRSLTPVLLEHSEAFCQESLENRSLSLTQNKALFAELNHKQNEYGAIRESLMSVNFDDITSNKDKSVKVLSSQNIVNLINSGSSDSLKNLAFESASTCKISSKNYVNCGPDIADSNNSTLKKQADFFVKNSLGENHQQNINDKGCGSDNEIENNKDENEDENEDDDDDDDDNEDDNDDDDGLTLNIPTYSQRMSIHNFNKTVTGRVRSISLMGPAQHAPFQTKLGFEQEKKLASLKILENNDSIDAATGPPLSALERNITLDDVATEEKLEDEMCSTQENSHRNAYQNIYVHDGETAEHEFSVSNMGQNQSRASSAISLDSLDSNMRVSRVKSSKNSSSKLGAFKSRSRSRSRVRSGSLTHSSCATSNSNILIPPEFYSKISQPLKSRETSNSDLNLKQAYVETIPFNQEDNQSDNLGGNNKDDSQNNTNNNMNLVDASLVSPENFTKYLTTGNQKLLFVKNEDSVKKKIYEKNEHSVTNFKDIGTDQYFSLRFQRPSTKITDDQKSLKSKITPDLGNLKLTTQDEKDKNKIKHDGHFHEMNNSTNSLDDNQLLDNINPAINNPPINKYMELDDEDLLMTGFKTAENTVKLSIGSDNKNTENSIKCSTLDTSKPKYKTAAFTLDLYGEEESDMSAWTFGGNR